MKRIKKQFILSGLFGSALLISSLSIAEVEWSYKGNDGPERWGTLSPQFAACANGRLQSPINIPTDTKTALSTLKINYRPAPLVIVEEGTTDLMIGSQPTVVKEEHVQVNFPRDRTTETIDLNGKKYRLLQFHLHTPSENQWHGRSFPMEIHFVHQGEDGKLAVIGVFVKAGKENPTLQKIIDHLPHEDEKPIEVKGVNINPTDLLPTKYSHYSFLGSLTTPPCSETVQWFVMSEPITASPLQINKLRKVVEGNNARPVQPLNDRSVTFSESQ